ncbi:glutamyl-tRNA synthetase [Verrucomicrobium sp. GAS474]|uniref:glutamate--tRNA ligase n=1 Tax=Verrucomicrobium sp. GAS474 TaxID=1882831 RepID=UPI00087D54EB|nr:glutamate--tRNA ligase [Verrucomicrobium sp. GAS474]SDT95910.1 glutamyl-tRNA synthetase [Verrucomicrobium sp. GAS474]
MTAVSSPVRVRFAPSPTGLLHIGGARTALFNWLYARHTGGKLILRIEDTDAARNTPEAVAIIFEGLKWLGLNWDEGPSPANDGTSIGDHGPYFQSQRGAIYKKYVDRLLAEGKAYEHEGAVKFRTPKTPITVPDAICGDVTFDRTMDPDLVIQRKDGSPVFHLVNVVDDLEMKITHVIRGEDHLSNTPKHLALFEAFGATPPTYAHIPLILNTNGSKMSKRDEGASIGEYIENGYLPEAVRNFLCLLGWSPKENREVVPIEEVVEKFDLPQVNRSNARFDINKLYWITGEYMRAATLDRLAELAVPALKKQGVIGDDYDAAYLRSALAIVQEKVKLGKELGDWLSYFFKEDFAYDPAAVAKVFTPEGLENLKTLRAALAGAETFTAAALEESFKTLAAAQGKKIGAYIHPIRLAVSGRSVGPSLYHLLEVLGKDRTLARADRALAQFPG